ncbi:ABC transporter permease [Neobacillus vireti]|uniref:Transport permease protein n=1 Tax=Neobacillus vireti LMG 21834 TaxID=1131730 RepID=A0AB94IQ94_9BACI|nr:ABC transporter permease [Neobacillus vireti]ETI69163.1 ABC-2 type transporter [Neobacillus vireti LMG 21834]KLT15541.1 teichoic acid ABC transporter permease [Neobacillus vireti]
MKSFFQIIKDHANHFYLIIRLSLFELKSSNNNNYLGILWVILNPLILISIYWFVFGIGIRGGQNVHGVAFLPWLLSGITVWFFISQSLTQGAKSIYSRIHIISKMNFPMSVIPSYIITSLFYQHIILIVIAMVLLGFYGFFPTLYIIQLPYMMLANFALLIGISLVTSTLTTIIRDVQMVVQSVVRALLYLTPILWPPDKLPASINTVLKVNPIYYIIEGYRSSLLGTNWYFIENKFYTLYFWMFVLSLLFIGSFLHMKFRNRFVDYL